MDKSSGKFWFEQALLPEGWGRGVRLTVRGGVIAQVEVGIECGEEDEQHRVALPGLANVHCHAFQRGMAGLAEVRGPASDNFWTWRELMYRFVERVGPEELEAIANLAYVEMLESGFTRVGEFHYLHHGAKSDAPMEMVAAVCAAAERTGIGLTLLPSFYAHANFGGVSPTVGQRAFVLRVDEFARLVEGSRAAVSGLQGGVVGVAPHSLRAVTPEELRELLAIADGGPVHIHAAEQTKEVEDCVAWSGARPVEWLLDHAPVDERWCVIHATHMTAAETERLARSGSVAGLCPVTEANLGDGIFPTARFMETGGRIGVGTDSNVLIGAAEELRALEYAQRLQSRSRNVLARAHGASTGGDLFRAALAGGAQAMGIAGGLAVGASADFFSLDLEHPSLCHREGDALVDSFVFGGGSRAVDCVWRAGKRVVRGGRHVEREGIEVRYRATIARLLR